jgi:anti-anti-sigma regulatory factor
MLITITVDGATAVISPIGDIDFGTLPDLTASGRFLPESVTRMTWDMSEATFVDVAGLHLLVHERRDSLRAGRTLTVTGLGYQPTRLLQVAHELFPAEHWDGFLPGGALSSAA